MVLCFPDNSEPDEQHEQAQSENQQQPYGAASLQSGIATPLLGYMMPAGQFEVGQTMVNVLVTVILCKFSWSHHLCMVMCHEEPVIFPSIMSKSLTPGS